jgi:uncharacterized protein YndB with AHSA1/START domain
MGIIRSVASTSISRHVRASRERVYAALLDPEAVVKWKVPTGMRCHVHSFEPRVGGTLRISLTYEESREAGKTTTHTDTYQGRFLELIPNERVVEVDEFETSDPALRGEMTVTITLEEADGGTNVTGLHEGLPPGLRIADNEAGWKSALARLAALVEE